MAEYRDLYEACNKRYEENPGRRSFSLVYNRQRHRISLVPAQTERVFCVRKFGENIPDLYGLHIPNFYLNQLLDERLTGLVLVAGPTHSGKTTTCSSWVVERLKKYGGIGIAVEDPVELPLEGTHGDGTCYQIDAEENGGFSKTMRDVVRMSPDMIFMGEIRDEESAGEVIRAGINGHLVIATLHSEDTISALLRLKSFASAIMGEKTDQLLAEGLAAVLHQKLTEIPGGTQPEVEFLSLCGPQNNGYRGVIRDGKYHQLSSAISQQKTLMKMEAMS